MEEEEKKYEEEIKEEEEGVTPTPNEDKVELTAEPDPSETQKEEAKEEEPKEEEEPKLTQSQVNAIMAKTRQEARERTISELKEEVKDEVREELLRELYERYGVSGDEELNGIFGKGQAYDVLNDDYTNQGNELKSAMAENALLKSGISRSRWDDARAILGAKGLDITEDNILSELGTHPEWNAEYRAEPEKKEFTMEMGEEILARPNQEVENAARIRKLGMPIDSEETSDSSEEEKISKMFNI